MGYQPLPAEAPALDQYLEQTMPTTLDNYVGIEHIRHVAPDLDHSARNSVVKAFNLLALFAHRDDQWAESLGRTAVPEHTLRYASDLDPEVVVALRKRRYADLSRDPSPPVWCTLENMKPGDHLVRAGFIVNKGTDLSAAIAHHKGYDRLGVGKTTIQALGRIIVDLRTALGEDG